jgi:hypothetical protein
MAPDLYPISRQARFGKQEQIADHECHETVQWHEE